MRDCVSHLELLRWEARPEAERSLDANDHLRTCARCAAALAELEAARQELLGVDPHAQSLVAARAILARVAERRRKAWWRFVVPLALTPVAAAAMMASRSAREWRRERDDASAGRTRAMSFPAIPDRTGSRSPYKAGIGAPISRCEEKLRRPSVSLRRLTASPVGDGRLSRSEGAAPKGRAVRMQVLGPHAQACTAPQRRKGGQ